PPHKPPLRQPLLRQPETLAVVGENANRRSPPAAEHKQAIPRRDPPAASIPGTAGPTSRCPSFHPRPRSPPECASAVRSGSPRLPQRAAQPTQIGRGRPFPLNAHLAPPPL